MKKLKFKLTYYWYKLLMKLGLKSDEIYYIGGSFYVNYKQCGIGLTIFELFNWDFCRWSDCRSRLELSGANLLNPYPAGRLLNNKFVGRCVCVFSKSTVE